MLIKYLLPLIILFAKPAPVQLSSALHGFCIEFSISDTAESEFSVFITDIPTELQIVLYNGTTEYKFQGTANRAIRAKLPAGQYRMETYYWYQRTSAYYYVEIKEGSTLHITAFFSDACIIEPPSRELDTLARLGYLLF